MTKFKIILVLTIATTFILVLVLVVAILKSYGEVAVDEVRIDK